MDSNINGAFRSPFYILLFRSITTMNSAKRDLLKREKRNLALAETIGWIVLAVGGFLCAKGIIKGLEIFFSLQGIH